MMVESGQWDRVQVLGVDSSSSMLTCQDSTRFDLRSVTIADAYRDAVLCGDLKLRLCVEVWGEWSQRTPHV